MHRFYLPEKFTVISTPQNFQSWLAKIKCPDKPFMPLELIAPFQRILCDH